MSQLRKQLVCCSSQLSDCVLDHESKKPTHFLVCKEENEHFFYRLRNEKHLLLLYQLLFPCLINIHMSLLYQKCLCLSPDSEQKGPTPSGSSLNQPMAYSFVTKKPYFFLSFCEVKLPEKQGLYFMRQDELNYSLFQNQKILIRSQGRLMPNWLVF